MVKKKKKEEEEVKEEESRSFLFQPDFPALLGTMYRTLFLLPSSPLPSHC